MNEINLNVCRKYEPKVISKLEILDRIMNDVIPIHESISISSGKERHEL